MRKNNRLNGEIMELDCRYVLHIPLSKWENDELVVLDIDSEIDELINQLEVEGFGSFYITKVESFYKTRRYDEILITIFAADGDGPHEIFKNWFNAHNDVLSQEAFSFEFNNSMFIEKF